MTDISQGKSEIVRIFSRVKEVYYLDFPNHFNVGDNLIFLGALQFFQEMGIRLKGCHSWATYRQSDLDKVPTNVAIVMHGGGNFGDVYDTYEQFRLEVTQRCPRHKLIIMPQTIHYNLQSNLAKSASILSRHPDLTVLCRDEESLHIARSSFSDKSYLCPDMVHFLELKSRSGSGRLVFRRRDKESAFQGSVSGFDWGDLLTFPVPQLYGSVRVLQKLERRDLLPNGASTKASIALQRFVVQRAIQKFSLYEEIDTDRMHAMILGLLLGKRVVVHDNSYGKLSRYIKTWLADEENIQIAGS